MAKYDFFISYSTKDKEIAFKILDAIESTDHTCWIAPRDIPYGTPYARAIMEGIDDCDIFLVLISDNSIRSEDVLNEVDNAHAAKKTIIPVKLTDTQLPRELNYYLSRTQWLQLSSENLNEITTLLNLDSIDINNGINGYKEGIKPHSQDSNIKNKSELKAFIRKSFSYSNIHIALLVVLFVLGGIIGLVLYPFILSIYYEWRKRKGLVIPSFYVKQRKYILITIGIIFAALIILGSYLVYDTYKNKLHFAKGEYGNQNPEEIVRSNFDANSSNYEKEVTVVNSANSPNTIESSSLIKMTGNLGDKEMTLYLLPLERNQIKVELEIDGDKFSPSYNAYLSRRTLRVDLDDADGTYIGNINGIIRIENGTITYKGEASGQGKTTLFKSGNFEFKGTANKAITEMLQSQTNYESLSAHTNSQNIIRMTGMLAGKEMTLYLLPLKGNQIKVELEIDGNKFSPSYNAYLSRRTLRVDIDDADGTYIGNINGIIRIENGTITYKGEASGQGKTMLFKSGNFEFKGTANKAITEMLQSQSVN